MKYLLQFRPIKVALTVKDKMVFFVYLIHFFFRRVKFLRIYILQNLTCTIGLLPETVHNLAVIFYCGGFIVLIQ